MKLQCVKKLFYVTICVVLEALVISSKRWGLFPIISLVLLRGDLSHTIGHHLEPLGPYFLW